MHVVEQLIKILKLSFQTHMYVQKYLKKLWQNSSIFKIVCFWRLMSQNLIKIDMPDEFVG